MDYLVVLNACLSPDMGTHVVMRKMSQMGLTNEDRALLRQISQSTKRTTITEFETIDPSLIFEFVPGIKATPKPDRYLNLASWVSRTLFEKFPNEWEDYEFWLRDIVEACPLLLTKYKSKRIVTLITCWRLLCLGWMLGYSMASRQIRRLVLYRRESP